MSTPIACVSVPWKTTESVVGNRFGRTRFVIVAIPTGTSRSDRSSLAAATFARSIRVGAPTFVRASIEREVSITTNTCASVRTCSALPCW